MRISFCADFGSSCQTAAFLTIVQAAHHMLLNLYISQQACQCVLVISSLICLQASSLVYFSNCTAQHFRNITVRRLMWGKWWWRNNNEHLPFIFTELINCHAFRLLSVSPRPFYSIHFLGNVWLCVNSLWCTQAIALFHLAGRWHSVH